MATASAAINKQFAQAKQHFVKGEMQPTLALCQQILQADETFSPAYALMGDLSQQLGNYESANNFLSLAQKFDSKNPVHLIRQAQVLSALERWDEVGQKLSNALMLDPNNPTTLLLMGDVRLNNNQPTEAMQFYTRSKASYDCPEIDERMAYCHLTLQETTEAEALLTKLTKKYPQFAKAWMILGDVYREQNALDKADECFSEALRIEPASQEAQLGKAAVYLEQQKTEEGFACINQLLAEHPNYYRTYFVLGDFYYKQRNFPEAERLLQMALSLNYNFTEARRKLATILFSHGSREAALQHVEIILQQAPHDSAFQFLRSTLRGENLESAPREHVTSLFDVYADTFEDHLVNTLEYSTPTVIASALERVMQQAGDTRKNLSLFDAGCGTGLMAVAAKHLTNFRAGVDLSSKMVKIASERGLYAETAADDITDYLSRSPRNFDVIAAADVFVYVGNLEPFFAATAQKLAADGYFAFSIEGADDAPPFILRPSGRFAHATDYILQLGKQYGMKLAIQETVILRKEAGKPVSGCVFIFQR